MSAKTAPTPNVPSRATRSHLLAGAGAAEMGAVSISGAIENPFNHLCRTARVRPLGAQRADAAGKNRAFWLQATKRCLKNGRRLRAPGSAPPAIFLID